MDLLKLFERRKVGPAVRERILKFYPTGHAPDGERLRGWHPAPTLHNVAFYRDVMGKRAFISKFGRAAWAAMPAYSKLKDGRRQYVHRSAVDDNLWLARVAN
jgi:hypothetical protein